MTIPAKIRVVIGRFLLWFTEAAMNERVSRNRGEPYMKPCYPKGTLFRGWAK